MRQALILVLISFIISLATNSFNRLHASGFERYVVKICTLIKFIEKAIFKYA